MEKEGIHHIFLPGTKAKFSLIKSGLQAQNLCENFVISVSRYSPRSSGYGCGPKKFSQCIARIDF